MRPERKHNDPSTGYISPKELAARWTVGRSTVDRISRQAGLTRLCLGQGRNGTIRYRLDQVLAFEQSREVAQGRPHMN